MAESIVTAPDGTKIRVTHPEGASQDEIVARAREGYQPQPQGPSVTEPPALQRAQGTQKRAQETPPFLNRLLGVGEAAMTFGSGAIGAPVGGIGGLIELARTGDPKAASDRVQQLSEALTYSPRGESGQQAFNMLSTPFRKYHEMAVDRGNVELEQTGSPGAATAVQTLMEAGPMAFGYRGGRTPIQRSRDIRSAEESAGRINLDLDAPAVTQRAQIEEAATSQLDGRIRGDRMGELVDVMRNQRKIAKDAVDDAYQAARDAGGGVRVTEIDGLYQNIQQKLANYDTGAMPTVQRRFREMENVMSNLPENASLRLNEISNFRKRITQNRGSDQSQNAALGVMRRELDNWLDGLFDRDMISGDPAALQKWKDARAAHADFKATFDTNKTIQRLMKEEATPETYRKWILGASEAGFGTEAARVVANIKQILGPDHPQFMALRNDALLNVLDPLLGEQMNFSQFNKRYDNLITQRNTLARELFADALPELQAIREYGNAVNKTSPEFFRMNIDESAARAIAGHQLAKATLRQTLVANVMSAIRSRVGFDRRREIISEVMGYNTAAPLIPIAPVAIGGVIQAGNN